MTWNQRFLAFQNRLASIHWILAPSSRRGLLPAHGCLESGDGNSVACAQVSQLALMFPPGGQHFLPRGEEVEYRAWS